MRSVGWRLCLYIIIVGWRHCLFNYAFLYCASFIIIIGLRHYLSHRTSASLFVKEQDAHSFISLFFPFLTPLPRDFLSLRHMPLCVWRMHRVLLRSTIHDDYSQRGGGSNIVKNETEKYGVVHEGGVHWCCAVCRRGELYVCEQRVSFFIRCGTFAKVCVCIWT